jgi:hypothetical protein
MRIVSPDWADCADAAEEPAISAAMAASHAATVRVRTGALDA